MKKIIFLTFTHITFLTFNIMAQNPKEENQIKQTIITFAQAADNQDEKVLESVLDDSFRLMLNQLFGSKELSILDKPMYLSKIKSKEFGGDKREVEIKNIIILKNNASAQATFKGDKMTIFTLLQLIKNQEGYWKIVSDLPTLMQ